MRERKVEVEVFIADRRQSKYVLRFRWAVFLCSMFSCFPRGEAYLGMENDELKVDINTLAILSCFAWENSNALEKAELADHGLGGIAPYTEQRPPAYDATLACMKKAGGSHLVQESQDLMADWPWATVMFQHLLLRKDLVERGVPGWVSDFLARGFLGKNPFGRSLYQAVREWRSLAQDCQNQAQQSERDYSVVESKNSVDKLHKKIFVATRTKVELLFHDAWSLGLAEALWLEEAFLSPEIGLSHKSVNGALLILTSKAEPRSDFLDPVLLHEMLHVPLHAMLHSSRNYEKLKRASCVFSHFSTKPQENLGYDTWDVFFEESFVRSLTRFLRASAGPVTLELEPFIDESLAGSNIYAHGIEQFAAELLDQSYDLWCALEN